MSYVKSKVPCCISSKAGKRKIVLGSSSPEAKQWINQIQASIHVLKKGKSAADLLFTKADTTLISRVNFKKEFNETLKIASKQSGKRIYTHSFRVSMITELLKTQPIQDVKNRVGHRDIRTTEVYSRAFMSERQLYKAMQGVYNRGQLVRD